MNSNQMSKITRRIFALVALLLALPAALNAAEPAKAPAKPNILFAVGFHDLLVNIQKMRDELKTKNAELTQRANDKILQTSPTP